MATQETNKVFKVNDSSVGFNGFIADDVLDMLIKHSKVSKDKFLVDKVMFRKLMNTYDSINGAAYDKDVVASDGYTIDKLNIIGGLDDLLLGPRDIRFEQKRLVHPNVVVNHNDDISTQGLSRGDFNTTVDYLATINSRKDGLNVVSISAAPITGTLSDLKNHPLIYVKEDGSVGTYCRIEPEDMKAPVVVDESFIKFLYTDSVLDDDINRLKDSFLEAIRQKVAKS